MKRLGVCLDSVTLLREKSDGGSIDPVHCIAALELSGTDSVVYTLWGNGSKNEARDLKILRECIHSHFNLRISPNEQSIQLAIHARAEMVTLIGLTGDKVTSFDVTGNEAQLTTLVGALRNAGIVINALIEPDANHIKAAVRIGADYVDLNAERYIRADSVARMEQELDNLKSMASAAARLNLGVTTTGDFTVNTLRQIQSIENIEEVNIGYSVFGRAMMLGVQPAIQHMLTALKN